MTQEHPITPPPELVQQWRAAASNVPASLSADPGGRRDYIDFIATQAAQWGADQELEACCQSLYNRFASPVHQAQFLAQELRDWLRAARRPKPPSLKARALGALAALEINEPGYEGTYDTIRRALEFLDD